MKETVLEAISLRVPGLKMDQNFSSSWRGTAVGVKTLAAMLEDLLDFTDIHRLVVVEIGEEDFARLMG